MSDDARASWYAKLHHGYGPRWSGRVPAPAPHRDEYELGELEAVVYRMRLGTPNGETIRYRHDFAAESQPMLFADERGQLHARHGHYTTTTRGITDLPRGVKPMANEIVRYAAAPPPPLSNPYGRTRGQQNLQPYRGSCNEPEYSNPDSDGERMAKVVISASAASLVGGWAVGQTRWSLFWKGFAQGVFGVGAGWFLRNKYPNLATGLVGYGAVAVTQGGAAQMKLNGYLGKVGAGSTTTTGTTQQMNGAAPAAGLPRGRVYDHRGQALR